MRLTDLKEEGNNRMKKKVLLLVMSLSILMLAGGCSKKNSADDAAVSGTPAPTGAADLTGTANLTAAPTPVPLVRAEYKLSDYIKLGEYKGIEVTVVPLTVTDADIETAVQSDLSANATTEDVTGRAVETGDIVNMDFEGLLDGVAFDGGTATAQDLTIGSGAFIPGFEDQLIGAKTGDKLDVNVTFPADYQEATLAGKPVVFKVTVNSIKKSVVPELTEEYVKANTDFDTIDAYKKDIKDKLEATNEQTIQDTKANNVFSEIVDNSTITLPQTLIDYYTADRNNYYTQTAAAYGMDLAAFIAANGSTQEDFDAYIKSYAESLTKQELVLKAIIKAENMELTDAEYQEGVTKIVTENGYASEEELLKTASEEQIKESLLWQKAMNFVIAQSVEI